MSRKLESLESNAKAASVDFPIWEHLCLAAQRPLEAKCQPVGTRPPLRQHGQSRHLCHSAKTFMLSQLRFSCRLAIRYPACNSASQSVEPMRGFGVQKIAKRPRLSAGWQRRQRPAQIDDAVSLLTPERQTKIEPRCTCSSPTVMWEGEYFCAVTGDLSNRCSLAMTAPLHKNEESEYSVRQL